MSEQERLIFVDKLNKGLRESFRKMLLLKIKLGQTVIVSDGSGHIEEVSATEAWNRYVVDVDGSYLRREGQSD